MGIAYKDSCEPAGRPSFDDFEIWFWDARALKNCRFWKLNFDTNIILVSINYLYISPFKYRTSNTFPTDIPPT